MISASGCASKASAAASASSSAPVQAASGLGQQFRNLIKGREGVHLVHAGQQETALRMGMLTTGSPVVVVPLTQEIRRVVERGFAHLNNWRILTKRRTDPARATHLLRALLVLTNIEATTGNCSIPQAAHDQHKHPEQRH
ncbi:hypothetical protein ACH47Z_39240 [Streptomyces sp. NPDC020192]|uniref:hypothetical protein n=1 Tax=Streptomyces sp. NPDC020192 TaxID=3365066 RepID=UPI0037A54177